MEEGNKLEEEMALNRLIYHLLQTLLIMITLRKFKNYKQLLKFEIRLEYFSIKSEMKSSTIILLCIIIEDLDNKRIHC